MRRNRDIKYIGMDVHKQATVIAVLNGSGKLVMESIVETKASSILQFIRGLRGEDRVRPRSGYETRTHPNSDILAPRHMADQERFPK